MKLSKKTISLVAAGIVAGTFLFSFITFAFHSSGKRYLFYFPSYGSDTLCMEARYLPRKSVQGSLESFMDELVLGPMTNRYKPVFPLGTTVEFSVVKDRVLYVNLGGNIVNIDTSADDISSGVELFKKNIRKNFPRYQKICVFVNGKNV